MAKTNSPKLRLPQNPRLQFLLIKIGPFFYDPSFLLLINLLYEIYVFSWNNKTLITQWSFSLVPKTEKQQHCSRKTQYHQWNGSYGIVVILTYLSPQGLTSAQPGGVHSAGNILFNSALPLLSSRPSQWVVSSGPQLPRVLHCRTEAATSALPCKQIQRTLPHTPDFWLSGWGALMFKTPESHHLSLCFPPVGINEMLLFFLTVFPVKCPKCPISAPHRSVKASCRKIKAS